MRRTFPALALVALVALAGCPAPAPSPLDYDVTVVDNGPLEPMGRTFCSTPGADAAGAQIPRGFCMRQFAVIREARVLTFAPNGDLFVASPSVSAPGGAAGGEGRIVVLSDDDHDGVAERSNFLDGVSDVHGLAFARGSLYFTTSNAVMRVPYAAGQRTSGVAPETVAPYEAVSDQRWTHGLAASPGGALYTSQGVHSARTCPDNARAGSVTSVGDTSLDLVAAGLRNPMYLRCHPTDDVCMAAELGDDGGRQWNAVERMIALRSGSQFGFPCCATVGQTTGLNDGHFNCSGISREDATFPLNDTPFGLDWERGRWPLPFRDGIFVALHGSFYSQPAWAGARVVFAPTDPVTHAPNGPFLDFIRGFAPGGSNLDRPADIAFSPDGRLFVSDDMSGAIWWLAPESLHASWM